MDAMEANQLKEVIEKGFKELRTELDGKFEKIDAKFEKIDARFEKIDKEFEKIDARFEKIDAKFEKIDAKFEKIDKEFEKIDARFDGIHIELTAVGNDARHAHVLIENLRHDLGIFHEGESAPLERRVSALEVRVTTLERKRPHKK